MAHKHGENTGSRRREPESPKSSLLFVAQSNLYERKIKASPMAQSYSTLPKYESPTPGAKRRPYYNPFNDGLPERFCAPTCSPDVFSKVKSPTEVECGWTIEHISILQPAKINSPYSSPSDYVDSDTESKVQSAIDQYFMTSHNIPSPLDGPGLWKSFNSASTPNDARTGTHPCMSTPTAAKQSERRLLRTLDVAVQTDFSLPPVLPEEVLEVLKPYLNNLDESSTSNDECNISASTLRRKLFFHNGDEPISPVKCSGIDSAWKEKFDTSFDWTPVKGRASRRADQDPEHLPSSPDLSPISMKQGERSRLDFTREMAVDSFSLSSSQNDYMSCSESPIQIENETKPSVDAGYHTLSCDDRSAFASRELQEY